MVPGEGDSAEAVVERVEELVLKALQPEVLKSQILQGLENKTLKPGQSPREFVEEVRAQLMSVMPELTQESVSRLLILHTVKGAPAEWRQRLLEANFTNVDDLVHKLTLLQSVRGQSNSARRVAVNRSTGSSTSARRCYACHKVGHIARDCTSGQRSGEQSSATRCSKCTLRGHDAGSCRTQCRKCHQTGHIQAHCTSGSAPVSRRVVVGSTYSLEVQLQGKPMTAVLDSGSEKTLVSKATADLVGLRVQPSNRQVLGPGKEQLIVYGCSVAHLAINGDEVVLEVLVTDCRDSIILGTDFLRAAEVSVDFGSGQVTVFGHPVEQRPVTVCRCSVAETFEDEVCDLGLGDEADFVPPFQRGSKGKLDLSHLDDGARQQVGNVVEEYADVFSVKGELGSVTGGVEHCIELEAAPKKSKPYPVPHALKGVVHDQIEDMLSQGVIRKCTSPYASPVLLVPKRQSDGEPPSYRFCTDFRAINRVTVKDRHPLPRIESLLAAVGPESCVFTQLDQRAAYWQMPIRECDQEKTAFVTDDGQYCYKVLPYGLCNGPSSYQRLMMEILGDLMWKSVLVYLDDVLIFSSSMEEHMRVLREVFARFRAHNLKLNPSKCVFSREQVTFLGHVLTRGCVRPAADNVAAVRSYRRPTNRSEVRRYLGLCGYMRHFVPNFSTRAAPLTALTSESHPFVWTGECEQSFQDLKEAITSYPVVRSADVSQPFVLTTDACGLGWGCTLSQTCDGKEYVVAYASGKWSRPETRYSTTEHELLAVIRAARRFRHFLLGVHFTVVTDHQALKWLWNIDDPSGRLARWILHLSQFDFEVQHRRGVDIPHADALSRDPVSEDSAVTDSCDEPTVSRCVTEAPPSVTVETDSVPAEGGDQTAGVGHSPFDLPSELQQATREDPVLSAVLHCLQTGETDDERLGDAGTFYMRGKDSLFVRDGLVCRQTTQDREPQIIVPSSMQSRIIRLAHDVPMSAHFGVTRTLHQITRRYFWYNLKVTVRDYCRSCLGCARVKRPNYSHREGIGSVPVVGEPFAQWSADILGPLPRTESGNCYVLVISDLFTKWVETYCLPDQRATTVADCFVDLISRFGVPKSILTDQGTNFESALVKRICELLGISKLRCTAAHPQTDGQTERFNRTLCDSLTHYVNSNQTDWDKWVGVCVSAFRFTKHSTTGYSPFELVHGVEARVPVVSEIVDDAGELGCSTYQEYVNMLKQRLTVDRGNALLSIENRQQRSMVPNSSDIQLNDKVMLKVHAVKRGRVKKLSDRFTGPFVVVKVMRPDYEIKRGRKRLFVHGSNLKKVASSVRDDLVDDVPQPSSVTQSESTEPSSSGVCVTPSVVPRRAESPENRVETDDVGSVVSFEISDSSNETEDEGEVYVTKSGRQSKPAVRFSP